MLERLLYIACIVLTGCESFSVCQPGHLINKSSAMAVYLEVGSRNSHDLTTCSDIDMMSSNADGRFVHKDGAPYPKL